MTSDAFDLDAGLLAVMGPVRLGLVAKNLLGSTFEAPDGTGLGLGKQVPPGGGGGAGPRAAGPRRGGGDAQPVRARGGGRGLAQDERRGRRAAPAAGARHR